MPVVTLTATDLRDRIAAGALSAEEVANAFLTQIEAREPAIGAWAFLDGDDMIAQARRLDADRRAGRPLGALHGLPVAVKDVIDVARMPTGNGTPIDDARIASEDATCIARLRAAGAIIAGKTVTAELAFMHPGKTRNPVNGGHTPGGSSSGSAAAVASRMAPLAIGTQTGGSVIRPASFCGCVGYKPTFGRISRAGVLRQSQTLDTIGVFASSVADAALLGDALFGHDPRDPAMRPGPGPRLLETARARPPVTPTLALLRMPGWEEAVHPDMAAALDELADHLGDRCFEVTLPPLYDDAVRIRERINLAEMARNFDRYARHREALSPRMIAALDEGGSITARDYLVALDWPEILHAGLKEILSRCDAILTAAAPGPAPEGLESTGNSIFNGLWTMTGMPAVTVPLFESQDGLPMGAQLVGPREGDARLLRTAGWLVRTLSPKGEAR
ncbi:Asp-tRNA Asn/Glu-tRNA Gln amidotransferase subunit A [Oceaniovalibus guishaninsula JLT2003]|uniref:Asp-tRNA Asn/Glu-tRNA Gln amidotransferase subunit A n=1 Tax=Oceaniovalibus guishaninsula JLT2003 TaxID=1231392 RepID=K2H6S8_9RHOB|nr:Asp-tRNA Asn/Glu-tRNA Gln amidotransferase subunit A [Oceaniovalibus guishaninsula JLT2003]